MKGNYRPRFFLVIALIAVLTYICFAGNFFGIKIPGVNNIVPGIDINGGIDALLYAVKEGGGKPTQKELDTAKVIIGKRLDKEGILDRTIAPDVNGGRIVLQIPWAANEKEFNPDKTLAKIGKTALLTFQEADESLKDEKGNYKPTGKIVLQGTDIVDAMPQPNAESGGMQVSLTLSPAGKTKFAEATGRLIGKPIVIFMDDQFISDPVVQSHITNGDARITLGNDTSDAAKMEAKELADTIRAGSLPFRLEAKSVNAISPMLGKGALDVTIKAFIVAFILICLFITFYYRLPGLIASIALFSLAILQLLLISWINITVTITGLAGIILAVGMGIDANVIIFERIKEELRSGKTLRASIDLGFERAFAAILDGNLTTLIAAAMLYIFGTGSMVSFAYTLTIGVILSFFTALTLTKTMMKSVAEFDIAKHLWLYGVKEVHE